MKSYRIHLIRHGAIEDTLSGAYIGTTDATLSDEGKRQLKLLDHNMNYPYAKVVFTSPLKRCKETCKIIYSHIEPIVIDQLIECNFGEWEGKTAQQLTGDENFSKWLAGDPDVKPPKGESNADFTRRICLMFESIVNGLIKTGNTDCAIVTHGGIIMTLLSIYGLPQAKPFDWACDNGYGYSIRVTPFLWQRDKVCEVYDLIPKEKENEDE